MFKDRLKGKNIIKTKKNEININKNIVNKDITDNVSSIKSLYIPEALLEEKDYLYLGHEKYLRVFAVSVYPNEVCVGWLDELFNIGNIDISVYNEFIPNDLMVKQLTKKTVQVMSEFQTYSDNGDILRLPELKQAIQDLEDERAYIQTNKDKMFYVTIVIGLHAKNLDELFEKTLILEDILAKKSAQLRTLVIRQSDGLLSFLPLCKKPLEGYDRNITTFGLSTMFPISNPDLTHPKGALIGSNYFTGSPFFFDQFIGPPALNNPHLCVFGIPGAGKSVFIKSFLNKNVANRRRCAVIDPEGEYGNDLKNLLGGEYITINPDVPSGINLFDIELAYGDDGISSYVPINEKIVEIKALLSAITRYSTDKPLNPLEQVGVEQAVIKTYENFGINKNPSSLYKQGGSTKNGNYIVGKIKKDVPILSDFIDVLSQIKGCENLSHLLFPYKKGGSLGMFDCKSELDDNIRVIGFNLSKITDEFTKFYASFVILSWLWQRYVQKYKQDQKLVVFDETWMFMKYTESANFLETIARRGRKYRASLVFATQFIDEFLDSKEGLAIISSCASAVLMRQNASAAYKTVKHFNLASRAAELLQTFSSGEGIICLQGSVTAIRVEPLPYELPYITT